MIFERSFELLILRLQAIEPIYWLILISLIIAEAALLYAKQRTDQYGVLLLWSFFLSYLYMVFAATVFSRSFVSHEFDLISFDITTAWTTGPGIYGPIDTAAELIMNVLMFVPFGYILMRISSRTWITLAASFLITLTIETLQLLTRKGFFELADILLNFSGALIGWVAYMMMRKIRSNQK
ncbi:MAG: VanZ family protein [Clostridia bacterium]|nr:VanZ family protein [Clostridia bacterium]